MPQENKENHESRYIGYAIATLAILLAILIFFLAREYRTLRHESIVNARETQLINIFKNHSHLTESDSSVIRSWMTLDYVNRLFNLPPPYLQQTLRVTDPNYPRLTIGKLATETHGIAASTTAEVQAAVSNYLTNNP